MRELYPLKFTPILKDKIWGGRLLNDVLGKETGINCGESWELSTVQENESIVSNGALAGRSLRSLIKEYKGALVGEKVYQRFENSFPLLIKFIDALDDLSVQVHPSEKQKVAEGKTEMWYIIAADSGACLLSGFNSEYSIDDLKLAIRENHFVGTMNKIPVKAGDVFFIKSNQVHSIGGGILVAEIQQPSDTTYRIYDFDRKDANGISRELHIDQAFEVMNLSQESGKIDYQVAEVANLVNCPEFKTDLLSLQSDFELPICESFQILMNVKGDADLTSKQDQMSLKMGETILIPCNVNVSVNVKDQCKLLCVTVPV